MSEADRDGDGTREGSGSEAPPGSGGRDRPGETGAPETDVAHGERPELEWSGEQEFPDSPQEQERPGRNRDREQRKQQSPKVDQQNWRNNADSQGPRAEGMAHDGPNLGYGSGGTYFHKVNASASYGPNFGSVGGDLKNTHIHLGAERAPRTGHYTERDLDTVARRYTPSGEEEQVSRLLESEHVVVLRGQEHTGRRTTALYCLDPGTGASLTGQPRRVSILPAHEDLAALAERVEDPDHGPCFVLDATGSAWPRTITEARFRAAFGSFATSDKRLVVLVDEPAPSEHLGALLLDHAPPDPRELLLAHLADLLVSRVDGPHERAGELLEQAGEHAPLVKSWIPAMAHPGEAALVAAALDLWDQQERADAPSLDDTIAEQRRDWLNRRARELMAVTDEERAPWDQAYALAGAVLSGHPAAVISRAAELFAHVLHNEKPRADNPASFFTEPVERRLRHMRVREHHSRGTVLELVQPEAGVALLHVTWHEYPRTQPVLIEWLARLCEREDEKVAVISAAAQALALIAGYAPDTVLERTVERWSDWSEHDSPHHCMWAASWLLEALVFNQSPAPEALALAGPGDPRRRIVVSVARLLREWADPSRLDDAHTSGGLAKHYPRWITAMLTYGTYAALVPPIHDDMATALGNAARLNIRARRFAFLIADETLAPLLHELSEVYQKVLESTVTDAYRVGARVPVVRELGRWSSEGSAALLLLACHSMLGIAEVRTGASWDRELTGPVTEVDGSDRPFDLLLWLASGASGLSPKTEEQIRKLWIVALGHPETAQTAWRRLFRWDLQAGAPIPIGGAAFSVSTDGQAALRSPLREYLTDLFEEIYTRPQLSSLRAQLDRYHLLRTRIAPGQFPSHEGES